MKTLLLLPLLIIFPIIIKAQTTWTDGRFSNTLDIGSARNSNTNSLVGLSIHKNYNTSFQFVELGYSAAHGILFSAYMNNTVSGSLLSTGNTKYYHGPSQYGGGAGAIMFFGNGGTMDFHISPASTGANQDISWGTPKMRIKRDGNVGIGTNSPSYAKLQIRGGATHELFAVNRPNSDIPALYLGNNGSNDAAIAANNSNLTFGKDFGGVYTEYMRVQINTGNVGIGTTNPSEKLEVNGTIRTQEVKVESTGWPDYVFSDTYKLNSLSEVSNFISENGHLPNIPTAKEVKENGIKLGEMNAKLLEKIEELTLYLIEIKKENIQMRKELDELKLK